MATRLRVDIGGTFTDLVVVDEATGAVRVGKVLMTPKDPAHGVQGGVQALLGEARIAAGAVSTVVHGTTLATNALIERKGARTALPGGARPRPHRRRPPRGLRHALW